MSHIPCLGSPGRCTALTHQVGVMVHIIETPLSRTAMGNTAHSLPTLLLNLISVLYIRFLYIYIYIYHFLRRKILFFTIFTRSIHAKVFWNLHSRNFAVFTKEDRMISLHQTSPTCMLLPISLIGRVCKSIYIYIFKYIT